MAADIACVPLSSEHRPLLADWTAERHVKQWWTEAADHLDSFFETDDDRWPYIAYIGGEPFAYIQSWRPNLDPHYPWQHGMAPTTRGIDLFIGRLEKIGLGLGPRLVSIFAKTLFDDGASRVVIDPDLRNTRAIAAFKKAGFSPFGEADGCLLMDMHPVQRFT